MRYRFKKISSVFLAMLLLVSAILPSQSIMVEAASSLKAALKEESGKGIPADEGWSLYNALRKVPASNRSYINLTEGKHASWAKDEQTESEYNAMKPVYGADLKDARAKAYEALSWVDFEKMYYRHDIAEAVGEA